MQLLFQVVADELSHPKQRLVLYIEHLVVGEDVRVLVKVKGVLYLINLCLQLIELIIFYLWEVQLADYRALILKGRQNRIVKQRIV